MLGGGGTVAGTCGRSSNVKALDSEKLVHDFYIEIISHASSFMTVDYCA